MNGARLLPRLYWLCIVLLVLSGVVLPEAISVMRQDYSSPSNFISELGATGADYAFIINYFGFLPVAVCSFVAILFLAGRMPAARPVKTGLGLWIIGLPMGYLSAFLFPCDYGCPIAGSNQQTVHNVAAMVVYPAGITGLVFLSIGLRQSDCRSASRLACFTAVVTAICFPMMLLPEQADFRGFWQRLADYAMFALILGLGFLLPREDAHQS